MIFASLDGIKSNNNRITAPFRIFFLSSTSKLFQKIGCSSIKSPEDGAIELQKKLCGAALLLIFTPQVVTSCQPVPTQTSCNLRTHKTNRSQSESSSRYPDVCLEALQSESLGETGGFIDRDINDLSSRPRMKLQREVVRKTLICASMFKKNPI